MMVSQTHLKFEEVFTKWKIQTVVFCITSVISQVITYVLEEHNASTFREEIKGSRTI